MFYDEQGRLTLVVWSGSDGEERERVDITYDEDGKRLTAYGWREGGALNFTEIVYDENGLEIRNNTYFSDGTPLDYAIFQYDEKGRRIREDYHYYQDFGTGAIAYYVLEYDEKDNLIKRSGYLSNNELDFYEIYTYDDENKLVEYRTYFHSPYDSEPDSLMERIVYEYDESGKRVRAVSYSSDNHIFWEETY